MVESTGPDVVCQWCGFGTPMGAACLTCGSPMETLTRCLYCGDFTPDPVCGNCQNVLATMSNLSRAAPDRSALGDVLKEVIDRAPSP